MRLTYIVIVLLVSFNLFAFEWKKNQWANYQLVNGCTIFSMEGKSVKQLPGHMCLFMNDGNLISAGYNVLRKISPKKEVLWELPGEFHHQINFTHDSQKILALTYVPTTFDPRIREDMILVIDQNGKILHETRASDIFKLLNLKQNGLRGFEEISHFNSIYEINNVKPKSPSWMAKGNIIINSLFYGVFVLTNDLKRVVHHFTYNESIRHTVHDVQITERGTILLFNNVSIDRSFNFYSMAQELSANLQVIKQFKADPPGIFYSTFMGSVQELDQDTWLFTHFLYGTYIYSHSKKNLVHSIPSISITPNGVSPSQQVKALDLSKFLSFW